jgi:galactoside O-acetyltransferase
MAFLTEKELKKVGFKSYGNNVLISDKASIYSPETISIGSNVRIDDFCILSAGTEGIKIGNYIHIACYTSIIGAGKITLKDYCNISSRVAIYSSNDDYSGEWMTNPMVPSEYTNVKHGPVLIDRHVIIGAGSVILPHSHIKEGVSIGALSLVKADCEPNYIYAGNPLQKIKKKDMGYLRKEDLLNNHLNQ